MSINFTKSFNYMRQNTVIHQLDPRVKSILVIVYCAITFLFSNLSMMIFLFIFTFPLLFLAKTVRICFQSIASLTVLLSFILIINTWIISLNSALIICIRLLLLFIVFSLLFQTTVPDEITQMLLKIRIPYPVAFALSLSFRFVPTMARETEIIMDAQRSRGHRIEEKGIVNQIKNLFPLLIPLLINSIRRAYHVAEALETRAFGAQKHPTFLYPLHFKKIDWIFSVFLLIILGIAIFFSIHTQLLPVWLLWNLGL